MTTEAQAICGDCGHGRFEMESPVGNFIRRMERRLLGRGPGPARCGHKVEDLDWNERYPCRCTHPCHGS